MKLNKKECRKFAIQNLKMHPGNGILSAGQVDYIVRTAVRNIGRHRTLVLYIYQRERAASGDMRPLYTMFHSRDDYATLEQTEGGGSKWREASLENLGGMCSFTDKCAFCSQKDERRVKSYFKNDADTGFMSIAKAQRDILKARWTERQIRKEKAIISRMSCVKALPRGLNGWIHKSVMPSYFFFDYKRGSRHATGGVCSSCGKESMLSGVKQYVRKICPHCRKEMICKPRSRKGKYMYDRNTVQVIQNAGDGALVLRIIKIYYSYKYSDVPETDIYENARHFVFKDPESGAYRCESYYYSYGGLLTNWKKGYRPVYSQWQYYFEADMSGHLYTNNLPGALAGTPFQYCPISDFYSHFRTPLLVLPFLGAYTRHPIIENLVKTGFVQLASDIAYQHEDICLDETQHRTHRILQVAAEDVEFLRDIETDMKTLQTFQGYNGLKGRRELLLWQMEHEVSKDILPVLQYTTPHKFMRYLDKQHGFLIQRKTPNGWQRYKNMQDIVSEYRDYLKMCSDMEYNMKSGFVLYPKDLQKAHDLAAKRHKQKIDDILKKKFAAVYRSIAGRFDYEKDGMMIVCPDTPKAVIEEGQALHHCVGSYVDRMADRECIILFLRKCSDLSRPFYTIEIRDHEISQVRGLKNCRPEPEVQAFIKAWETQVLSRLDMAA